MRSSPMGEVATTAVRSARGVRGSVFHAANAAEREKYGRWLDLGYPAERALAMLGDMVTERLSSGVWREEPPA